MSYRDEFDKEEKGKQVRNIRFWFYNAALFFLAVAIVLVLFGPLVFHWPREVTAASAIGSGIISVILAVVGWRVYEYAYRNYRPQALVDAAEREREERKQLLKERSPCRLD